MIFAGYDGAFDALVCITTHFIFLLFVPPLFRRFRNTDVSSLVYAFRQKIYPAAKNICCRVFQKTGMTDPSLYRPYGSFVEK